MGIKSISITHLNPGLPVEDPDAVFGESLNPAF